MLKYKAPLVIGADGFIGSHLAEAILQENGLIGQGSIK